MEDNVNRSSPLIWTDAALCALYQDVKQAPSMQAVATVRGFTRQHIHQLLRKGVQRGLFRYQSLKARYRRQRHILSRRTADSLATTMPRATQMYHLAIHYSMPVGLFTQMLTPATRTHLRSLLRERRITRMQQQLLRRYLRFSHRLGHPPSLYELQCHSSSLSAGITRHWKTLQAFREAHNLAHPTSRAVRLASYRERIRQELQRQLEMGPISASALRGRVARRIFDEWLTSGYIRSYRVGHALYYHTTRPTLSAA